MNETVDTTNALDTPGTDLKAERIQLESPVGQPRLKAERIQLALRDLPGWRLQRNANQIERGYDLADAQQATRLFQAISDLSYDSGLVEVGVRGREVIVRLPISRTGLIEEPLFNLAVALEERKLGRS